MVYPYPLVQHIVLLISVLFSFQEWRHRSRVFLFGFEIRYDNQATSPGAYKKRQIKKCSWRRGEEVLRVLLNRKLIYP